jgi:uncharacterized protein YgfB (UPF0149 family)
MNRWLEVSIYGLISAGVNSIVWLAVISFYNNSNINFGIRIAVILMAMIFSLGTILGGYQIWKMGTQDKSD